MPKPKKPIDAFDPVDGEVIEANFTNKEKEKSDTTDAVNQPESTAPSPINANETALFIGGIEVVLPDSVEALWAYATDKSNLEVISHAQAGRAFIELKNQLPHGEFKKEVKRRGFQARRVNEQMRIAQMLMEQPKLVQQSLTQLQAHKLIVLAKLDNEQIEEIVESGEIDELAKLTRDELRKRVNGAEQRAEDLEWELQEERDKARNKYEVSQWSEPLLTMREESNYAAEAAGYHLDKLSQLLDQLGSVEFYDNLKPANERTEFNVGAQTFYLAATNVYAKALEIVKRYEALDYPKASLQRINEIENLSSEELLTLKDLYARMHIKEESSAEERRIKRTNKARAGKRGRPVGTKKGGK